MQHARIRIVKLVLVFVIILCKFLSIIILSIMNSFRYKNHKRNFYERANAFVSYNSNPSTFFRCYFPYNNLF